MNFILFLILIAMVKKSAMFEPVPQKPSVCKDDYVLVDGMCCAEVIETPSPEDVELVFGRVDDIRPVDIKPKDNCYDPSGEITTRPPSKICSKPGYYENLPKMEDRPFLCCKYGKPDRITECYDSRNDACTKSGYIWHGGNCCVYTVDGVNDDDCYNPNGGPIVTPKPGTCKYGYKPDKFVPDKCCKPSWTGHDICYNLREEMVSGSITLVASVFPVMVALMTALVFRQLQ